MSHMPTTGPLVTEQVATGHRSRLAGLARLVWIGGQSNSIGDANAWQGDVGLNLQTAYPLARSQQLGGVSDPIQWYIDVAPSILQPYGDDNEGNMGIELAVGRMLYERGGIDYLAKFGIQGLGVQEGFIPTANYPLNRDGTGLNVFDQIVAQIREAEAESGLRLGCVIFIGCEGDVGSANGAAHSPNLAANLTAFMTAIRAEFGSDIKLVLAQLNNSASSLPYLEVGRAAQAAYVASDPQSVLVDIDDVPMKTDNLHYDAYGYPTIGNRVTKAALDILGFPSQRAPGPTVMFLGAEPADPGPGTMAPRSRPDLIPGDVEILWIASGEFANTPPAVTTAEGFEVLDTYVSLANGFYQFYAAHKRTVTQEVLDDNDGLMPTPLVAATNTYETAKIFAFRSPTGSMSVTAGSKGKNDAYATAISISGSTTTDDYALVVTLLSLFGGSHSNTVTGAANDDLTNFSKVQDGIYGVNANYPMITLLSGEQRSAGPYGAMTATTAANTTHCGMTLVMVPT